MRGSKTRMNERDFIAALRTIAPSPSARSLADDCAVLEIGGETLILTHDMMVAGVHFLPTQDPADVAWKLVATNLSDLAAKGAEPVGVLLGYMLGAPGGGGDARFVAGLGEALAHYATPLLGGDTVGGGDAGGGPQALGLTAIGRATHRPVPSRGGARVGDELYLTGAVGAAMLGFEALRDATGGDSAAYRRPIALLREGQALAPVVTAMMDVSDGLLLDASRMARASGLALAIDRATVPIATHESRRDEALRWGDDYQLLFTMRANDAPPVRAWRIGTAIVASGSSLLLDGAPLGDDGLGYEHG